MLNNNNTIHKYLPNFVDCVVFSLALFSFSCRILLRCRLNNSHLPYLSTQWKTKYKISQNTKYVRISFQPEVNCQGVLLFVVIRWIYYVIDTYHWLLATNWPKTNTSAEIYRRRTSRYPLKLQEIKDGKIN